MSDGAEHGPDALVVAPTVGVEEEFILVDPATGHPVARNREVAAAASRRGVDLELELTSCQVETATAPHHAVADLLDELTRLRSVVAAAAAEVGVGVIASGAPPTVPVAFPITDTERYRRIGERFGMLAHEQGVCGCHVHVAVPDRETAIEVSNHLRHRLPVLLALSANSPVYRDADTGHASWRWVLWSRWPAAGPPPHLRSREHFESLVTMFVASGAILDDHMVYWDVRPSDHLPTIEVRVGDVQPTASEAAAFAAIVRGLTLTALRDIDAGIAAPEIDTAILDAAMWKAAHDGIDGAGIDVLTGESVPALDLVGRLVDDISDALDAAGDADLVTAARRSLGSRGNGATRRRRDFRDGTDGPGIAGAAMAEFTG